VPAEVAAELTPALPRIRAELAALETPGEPPVLPRVHGDFHIGQILAAGDRLVVLDFEGEPARPVADRAAPGTALRDVAAMLRSFDHIGRYVEHELGPGTGPTSSAGSTPPGPPSSTATTRSISPLLRALEFEKECYEFTYAVDFDPSWMYAAQGGMRWLLSTMADLAPALLRGGHPRDARRAPPARRRPMRGSTPSRRRPTASSSSGWGARGTRR
jgi:predicted trehalose synthase